MGGRKVGGFVQTPTSLVRDGTLSPKATRVLEIYKSYRGPWVSIPMPRLKAESGMGRDAINHARADLRRRGLLVRRQKSLGADRFQEPEYRVTERAYPPRRSSGSYRQYLDGFRAPRTDEERAREIEAMERNLGRTNSGKSREKTAD